MLQRNEIKDLEARIEKGPAGPLGDARKPRVRT
jgi:hypothetical protein